MKRENGLNVTGGSGSAPATKKVVQRLEVHRLGYKLWQNPGDTRVHWKVTNWGQEAGAGVCDNEKEAKATASALLLSLAEVKTVRAADKAAARQKVKELVAKRWYLCAFVCEALEAGAGPGVIMAGAADGEQAWCDRMVCDSLKPEWRKHHLSKPGSVAAGHLLQSFETLGIVGQKAIRKWAQDNLGFLYRWPDVKSQKELMEKIQFDMDWQLEGSRQANAKKVGKGNAAKSNPGYTFPEEDR